MLFFDGLELYVNLETRGNSVGKPIMTCRPKVNNNMYTRTIIHLITRILCLVYVTYVFSS
jgi:hypothetical protein